MHTLQACTTPHTAPACCTVAVTLSSVRNELVSGIEQLAHAARPLPLTFPASCCAAGCMSAR